MDRWILDLQFFADGGGAAGGDGGSAAAAAGDAGVTAPDAGEQRQKKRRENPLANVRYGRQPAEAPATDRVADGQQNEAANIGDQGEPKEESFDDLIKGKYKDAFGEKVQGIIRERLKGNQENEDKLNKLTPLLEMLGKKYNVDPTDYDRMAAVIGDDDSLYEAEAMERGMDVQTFKTVRQLEQANEQYKKQEERSIQEQRMRQHFDGLAQQAQQVRQLYPSFDLMTEMKNPTFFRLTAPNSGIDVRTAYEVVHRDELRGAEMQFAVQKSAERMSKAIQSGSKRPVENGLNSTQSAAPIKSDPRSLNKADREEIKRRVRAGEKIVF